MKSTTSPTIVPAEMLHRIRHLHSTGKKVVLVTGVFDLLHSEHHAFLTKAKQQGNYLVVAIESDVRVKELKGSGRPVWSQEQRKQALQEVDCVDAVFVLPDNFGEVSQREKLIAEIRPDVLAVSSHSPHLEKKRKILEKYGGEVRIVHDHNPAVSTTQLLKNQSTSTDH